MKNRRPFNIGLQLSIIIMKAACVVVAAVTGITTAATAKTVDEYQIAWVMPPIDDRRTVRVAPQDSVVEVKLYPATLYRASTVVTAKDGSVLLHGGTQLALMAYPKLLVCSLAKGAPGSVGSDNRVCLLDEDGDRHFDSYFLRSFGRSAMTTDTLWFAMNDKMPKIRQPVAAFDYAQIDRVAFTDPPTMKIVYARIFDKSRSTLLTAGIDRRLTATSLCDAYLPQGTAPGTFSIQRCNLPGLDITVVGREGEVLTMNVQGLRRTVDVRFIARYGALAGHEINGMQLSYANDDRP